MATLTRMRSLSKTASTGDAPETIEGDAVGATDDAQEAMWADFAAMEKVAQNLGLSYRVAAEPGPVEGIVVGKSEHGVAIRSEDGMTYIPVTYFGSADAMPAMDRTVSVMVKGEEGGDLTAEAFSRIGADRIAPAAHADDMPEALPPPESAAGMTSGADHQPEPARPAAVLALEDRMKNFDVDGLMSDDPAVRAKAEREFAALCAQAERVDRVYNVQPIADGAFPERLAAQLVAAIAALRQASAGPAMDQAAASAPQAQQSGGGGGGSLLSGVTAGQLVTGLAVGGAALALGSGIGTAALAGGALAFGGGSLALKALKSARDGLSTLQQSQRRSSCDVLADQVKSLAADIEHEAGWLRAHGMDGIVDELKASGHSMRELLPQMERGHPLERLGLQFKGLMQDPEFAARYGGLENTLNKFGIKAERYAHAAQAAGRDPEEVLEPALGRVESAVEHFPKENNGRFEAIAEKIGEVAEKIRDLINRMMGRLAPGRG